MEIPFFLSEPGLAWFAKVTVNEFTEWNFLKHKGKGISESGINLIVGRGISDAISELEVLLFSPRQLLEMYTLSDF